MPEELKIEQRLCENFSPNDINPLVPEFPFKF